MTEKTKKDNNVKTVKMWKVKVAGSYFITGESKEEKPYEVEGIIPLCEEKAILSFVKARYLPAWIKKSTGELPTTIYRYELIEDPEVIETDGSRSVFGMRIEDMNWEQLQDLATEFVLPGIPLIRKVKLEDAKMTAKKYYLKDILGIDIKDFTEQEIRDTEIICKDIEKKAKNVAVKNSLKSVIQNKREMIEDSVSVNLTSGRSIK